MKQYYTQSNIGKAKYVVNYHNGESKHLDGSPFYDIEIFKNKKKLAKFVKDLQGNGYTERGWNWVAQNMTPEQE